MNDLAITRIVIDPTICGGRPTVKGTRIRASDIVEMLANGVTEAEILTDFNELNPEDIRAAMHFAAQSIAHPILRVA